MSSEFNLEYDEVTFTKELRGVYGTFQTDKSFQVAYVLCSFPIHRIVELETAGEALDSKSARFEDLIQRDLDSRRVVDIVHDYLEKGDKKAIFFPPLLASLVAVEKLDGATRGNIRELYRSVDDWTLRDNWFEKTWDTDHFQLRLPHARQDTGYSVQAAGTNHFVHNYGCQLKWNDKNARLVVIDGQHRLGALKLLYRDTERRRIVERIHVPVCVIFYPDAIADSGQNWNIVESLRSLFVTINLEQKKVSGHFLVLLDDTKLSTLAVRQFAQLWKDDAAPAYSMLHLLEWNEREAQSTDKRMRRYSITTVSILQGALKEYLFANNEATGLTASFLNLEEVQARIELSDDAPSIEAISDAEFLPAQAEALSEQLQKYVTPAVSALFSEPTPYVRQIRALGNALSWLNEQVTKSARGAETFRDEFFRQHRRISEPKHEREDVRAIESQFNEKAHPPHEDRVYFLNVFQYGLIGAWVEFSRIGLPLHLSPLISARALIAGLEELCFLHARDFFRTDAPYAQLALFREGGGIQLGKEARIQWRRLLLSTFANERVLEAGVAHVKETLKRDAIKKWRDSLRRLAHREAGDYVDELDALIQRDYEKFWMDRPVSERHRKRLEDMHVEFGPKSAEVKKYIADELTPAKGKKARSALLKALEIEQFERD